jgi:ABC-type uncharacterized transport system substrate-binding protein
MRRRHFLFALGGAAAWPAAAPLAARAQQLELPVIGVLNSASPQAYTARMEAFHEGLSELGYSEGRGLTLEYRWAEGHYDRLPSMATDLVQRHVAVIAAITTPCAVAAKAATSTIPIVFEVGGDPRELGLVSSLSRPTENLTGVTLLNRELGPKRLELVHELVPSVHRVAGLLNPSNPNTELLKNDLAAAARKLDLELHLFYAGSEEEFGSVFSAIQRLGLGALLIGTDPFFNGRSRQLAALAMQHSMPAIYQYRDFTVAGGLASYGASFIEPMKLVGSYVARVVKGTRPADLPVQQSTKIELMINLKTAKALGLTLPPALLARADEVIE